MRIFHYYIDSSKIPERDKIIYSRLNYLSHFPLSFGERLKR
jgi:hypothetical protein